MKNKKQMKDFNLKKFTHLVNEAIEQTKELSVNEEEFTDSPSGASLKPFHDLKQRNRFNGEIYSGHD
jgi:hypothetical protein